MKKKMSIYYFYAITQEHNFFPFVFSTKGSVIVQLS